MTLPTIASREEWLAARTELLDEEKELTRRRDALNTDAPEPPDGRGREGLRVRRAPTAPPTSSTSSRADASSSSTTSCSTRTGSDGCPSCTAGHRRDVAGPARAPAHPRHQLRHGVTGPAGEARALQGGEGMGHPLVLVVRVGLQLRLRRHRRRVGGAAGVQLPHEGGVRGDGLRRRLAATSPPSSPAGAASCRSTDGCSTPTRSTPAASSRPAARTTSSTSPPSAARRSGRSRRAAAESARSATPDFAS